MVNAPTIAQESEAERGAEHPQLPPGTMVSDRYRIARALGEGGMGIVYAAEHVLMQKEVAVKVLHADLCTVPEVVARFEREAIAAARIDHPNVAGATDSGRLPDGACYLVLELLKGPTLRDELAKGPIPQPRALQILRGIASGVSAAHQSGVVHRDLKPENVMLVERDGTTDFVKVLDFGIAKVDRTALTGVESAGKILTRVGTVFGTPEYMAPEQAVGDPVDARADLYSLGIIFLEMLTGECPFKGKPLSILRERILAVGPPDMSKIPDAGARALVTRLLTRFPDDRMGSAAELVAAIDALAGTPSLLPPGSPTVPPPTPRSRGWLLLPVGLVAAAAITAGAFLGVRAIGRPAIATPAATSAAPIAPAATSAPPPEDPPATPDPPATTSVATPTPPVAHAAPHTKPRGAGKGAGKKAPR